MHHSQVRYIITNVYGSHDDKGQKIFFVEIDALSNFIHHSWAIVGDFNVIRFIIERAGTPGSFKRYKNFDSFINSLALLETSTSSHKFTWSNFKIMQVSQNKIEASSQYYSTILFLFSSFFPLPELHLIMCPYCYLLEWAQRKMMAKMENANLNITTSGSLGHSRLKSLADQYPNPAL